MCVELGTWNFSAESFCIHVISCSPETLFAVAEATGVEVRAKYNNYSRHGDYGQHTSASCWSPVINIMRDPRWGRNQVQTSNI